MPYCYMNDVRVVYITELLLLHGHIGQVTDALLLRGCLGYRCFIVTPMMIPMPYGIDVLLLLGWCY